MPSLEFTVHLPFANLRFRRETVLILCSLDDRRIILTRKPFYPSDILRFPGGGVEGDETPIEAAKRELLEELGIVVPKENFSLLKTVKASAKDHLSHLHSMTVHLVAVDSVPATVRAGDDVSSLVFVSEGELEELNRRMMELTTDMKYEGIEGSYLWRDYGRVYGTLQKIASEAFQGGGTPDEPATSNS